MPAAAAMSRVLVAAKPWVRKSLAAPSMSLRRRLPSSSSSAVLRGRPRGRRVGVGSAGVGLGAELALEEAAALLRGRAGFFWGGAGAIALVRGTGEAMQAQ